MNKFIWAWGSDGSVMYIYEVMPPSRFCRYHKLKQIKLFYSGDFKNVKTTAEDFIKRLENVL